MFEPRHKNVRHIVAQSNLVASVWCYFAIYNVWSQYDALLLHYYKSTITKLQIAYHNIF